jgi:hypothetical protein
MTLTGGAHERPRIYIGETDNLRRRLSGNYRNPGSGQQTSLRINALLREHLAAGGEVALAAAAAATVWLDGEEQALDLGVKRRACSRRTLRWCALSSSTMRRSST